MIEEDKPTLARKRAELVESLTAPLSVEERVRVQGELSLVNAKIKAINTTTAARLKADADRRKVAGMAEAQTNAARAIARAQAKLNGAPGPEEDPQDADDDPGQTEAIDGWIDAVLLRHDVEFTRSRTGKLTLPTAPKIVETLIDGIYAAARGQELPDLPPVELKAVKTSKIPKAKTKKQ